MLNYMSISYIKRTLMAQFDKYTLQITGRKGSIRLENLTQVKKRWIADALSDMFTVDDAYYDKEDDAIKVQNWHTTIDVELLRQNLNTIMEDIG